MSDCAECLMACSKLLDKGAFYNNNGSLSIDWVKQKLQDLKESGIKLELILLETSDRTLGEEFSE